MAKLLKLTKSTSKKYIMLKDLVENGRQHTLTGGGGGGISFDKLKMET